MHSHEKPNRRLGKITACIAALQIAAGRNEDWPFADLAERWKGCYVRFARNEDNMISPERAGPSPRLRVVRPERYAAFENAGPSRPDFSEPIYAHIEYIWVYKGGHHADCWNLWS